LIMTESDCDEWSTFASAAGPSNQAVDEPINQEVYPKGLDATEIAKEWQTMIRELGWEPSTTPASYPPTKTSISKEKVHAYAESKLPAPETSPEPYFSALLLDLLGFANGKP